MCGCAILSLPHVSLEIAGRWTRITLEDQWGKYSVTAVMLTLSVPLLLGRYWLRLQAEKMKKQSRRHQHGRKSQLAWMAQTQGHGTHSLRVSRCLSLIRFFLSQQVTWDGTFVQRQKQDVCCWRSMFKTLLGTNASSKRKDGGHPGQCHTSLLMERRRDYMERKGELRDFLLGLNGKVDVIMHLAHSHPLGSYLVCKTQCWKARITFIRRIQSRS